MSVHVARPWPRALEWGGDWLTEAVAELARLGFELRDGGSPGTTPGPRLMLALRAEPTLEHYDPELVTHWEVHLGRGRLVEVNRTASLPIARPFSWGRIQLADRIPETNQFLSFGGTLLADAGDDRTMYVGFSSPGPIVRWAGHSQGVDPLADEIGAFFARVMVPIDYQPEAETRIGQADPEALYSAFLHDVGVRYRSGSPLRESYPDLAQRIARESRRLEHDVPSAWRDGGELLAWLQLG